jgi:hypothetical protein
MSYVDEYVIAVLRNPDETALAALGSAEGGGQHAQWKAARHFWERALALMDDGSVSPALRERAQGEIARLGALLAPPPAPGSPGGPRLRPRSRVV